MNFHKIEVKNRVICKNASKKSVNGLGGLGMKDLRQCRVIRQQTWIEHLLRCRTLNRDVGRERHGGMWSTYEGRQPTLLTVDVPTHHRHERRLVLPLHHQRHHYEHTRCKNKTRY